jgi:hypothetical protein
MDQQIRCGIAAASVARSVGVSPVSRAGISSFPRDPHCSGARRRNERAQPRPIARQRAERSSASPRTLPARPVTRTGPRTAKPAPPQSCRGRPVGRTDKRPRNCVLFLDLRQGGEGCPLRERPEPARLQGRAVQRAARRRCRRELPKGTSLADPARWTQKKARTTMPERPSGERPNGGATERCRDPRPKYASGCRRRANSRA